MEHASCKLKSKNDNQEDAQNYLKKVEKYFDKVKTCDGNLFLS